MGSTEIGFLITIRKVLQLLAQLVKGKFCCDSLLNRQQLQCGRDRKVYEVSVGLVTYHFKCMTMWLGRIRLTSKTVKSLIE